MIMTLTTINPIKLYVIWHNIFSAKDKRRVPRVTIRGKRRERERERTEYISSVCFVCNIVRSMKKS